MCDLTIVMYHYVRDFQRTRYPGIKGLAVDNFVEQLRYLDKNYSFIRMEDCLDVIHGRRTTLPENPVLLTFDDGYIEHFTEVFPVLSDMNIQGSFFPPVQSTLEKKVLNVNKIHFILEKCADSKELLHELKNEIVLHEEEFNLLGAEKYYRRITPDEHPYDTHEVTTFKRVLQRELPETARMKILNRLFEKYVGISNSVFAKELYMDFKHLTCMLQHGMFIGGHGYSHRWLNSLEKKEQEFEVRETKNFLHTIGVSPDQFVMCYPYGGYNRSLIDVLEQHNFKAGLTTNSEIANVQFSHRFDLARLDTNYFS